MKYCANCGRLSAGDPLFCPNCGSTFGVKLCPRHHVNRRDAQVCTQCGSHDLSQPGPRTPWRARTVLALLRGVPVAAAVLGPMVAALLMVHVILQDPDVQRQLVVLGLIAWLLWWLWQQVPRVVRTGVRRGGRWVEKQISKKREH